MERETLTIMKACEVVGVSRRTIYNWISAGKVEYIRTAGGSIRIFAGHAVARSGHEAPSGAGPVKRPPVHTRDRSARNTPRLTDRPPRSSPTVDADLRVLFHRLNNQLGIILAHAELLEAKSARTRYRARAAQLVTSALDAMGTAKSIRQLTEPALAGS